MPPFPTCCDELEEAIKSGYLVGQVDPSLRLSLPPPKEGLEPQDILYCPFCGTDVEDL